MFENDCSCNKKRCCVDLILCILFSLLTFTIGIIIGALTGIFALLGLGAFITLTVIILLLIIIRLIMLICCKRKC